MSELSNSTTNPEIEDKTQDPVIWNPSKTESNTRYKNSPYDLIDCPRIWLVNFSGTLTRDELETLDFDSIAARASKLPSGRGPWNSFRTLNAGDDPKKVPFKFGYDESTGENVCHKLTFDMILYLSESGEPVGYTYYIKPQDFSKDGEDKIRLNELHIYLDFSYLFTDETYDLNNSLETHIRTVFIGNLDNQYGGTEEYDYLYPIKKTIVTKSITKYPRYTNYIHHMKFDETNMIISGNKLITKDYFGKLELLPVTLVYPNVKVSMYNSDLIVLEWDKENYKITSLLRSDRNGRNYVYYRGNTEDINISGGSEITDMTPTHVLLRDVDKYVTDDKGNKKLIVGQENYLYGLIDKKILNKDGNDVRFIYNPYKETPGFIVDNLIITDEDGDPIDALNTRSRIRSEEFIRYINSSMMSSVEGERIDNNSYDPSRGIRGFIGSFIICNGYSADTTSYYNLEGEIELKTKTTSTVVNEDGSTSTVEIDNPVYIVNDNCILEKKLDSLIFYFTDNNSRIYYNPKLQNKEDDSDRLKYTISMTDTRNQILDGFRKNPITYSVIPDIIAAFGGLLFYKDRNNVLRYL